MSEGPRRHDLIAALLLLLLPVAVLYDCVLGGHRYLPYDLAEFPPVATTLSREEVAELRRDANYDATEAPIWFVPELQLCRDALARGRYPHWNPYARTGLPLAGHGHLGLFDPLHWPALLCRDPVDGLLVLTATGFALAGLLMYGLLRALRLQCLPALFGAVAFALSGTLTTNGHWFQRLEVLALLPGMLWAELVLARARGAGRVLPALGLAAAVCLAWSAGFPPFCIAVCLFAGLFGLCLLLGELRQGTGAALRLLLWLGLGFGLGLLLAAPTILQQAAFFANSTRTPTPTLGKASEGAFDLAGLLGLLFGDVFSHPGDRALPGSMSPLVWLLASATDWDTGLLRKPNYNFTEYAIYPGIAVLVLAGLGVAKGPRWRWLPLLGIAGALLLATGALGARHAFLVPGIQAVQPYRFAGVACTFVAVLAALGVQALRTEVRPALVRTLAIVALAGGAFCLGSLRQPGSAGAQDPWVVAVTDRFRHLAPQLDPQARPEDVTPELAYRLLFSHTGDDGRQLDHVLLARQRLHDNLLRTGTLLAIAGGLLFLLSLRGRTAPLAPLPACLLVLLGGAELWQHGQPLNRGRSTTHALDTDVHRFLRQQRDLHRDQGGILVARGDAGASDPLALPPGTLAADGIRDLHFYTFLDRWTNAPLQALYGKAFLEQHETPRALPDDERLQRPFFDALGLRFLLSRTPMTRAGERVGPQLRGPGGEFYVYERSTALPRAWVVPELMPVAGDAALVQQAVAPTFAPRRQALVLEPDARALDLPLQREPGAAARGVHFAHEDEKRLTLRVDDGPAGWLLLADTWTPGWEATIDGAAVPMLRANVCQRVLPVPGRACTVEWRYRTPGLLSGLALGAVGLLLAAGLLAYRWRAARAPAQA